MADIWKLLATPVKTPTETLVAGTVDFYNPGTTGESNRKDVYTDAAGTIVAANPYTLDSDAIAVLYGTGTYHVVIKDSSGNTEYDLDFITPDKEVYAFTPATLAELQAITGYPGATANLLARTTIGDGGGGQFYWNSADLSTEVTADGPKHHYVAPDSDPTGANGAWVKVNHTIISEVVPVTENFTTADDYIVLDGGGFTVAAGKTLTFNGSVEAGHYQIFYGDGAVLIRDPANPDWCSQRVDHIKPAWFDTSSGWSVATASAIAAGGSKTTVVWPTGRQLDWGETELDLSESVVGSHINLRGAGFLSTEFVVPLNANGGAGITAINLDPVPADGDSADEVALSDFRMIEAVGSQVSTLVKMGGTSINLQRMFLGNADKGIYTQGLAGHHLDDVWVENCNTNIEYTNDSTTQQGRWGNVLSYGADDVGVSLGNTGSGSSSVNLNISNLYINGNDQGGTKGNDGLALGPDSDGINISNLVSIGNSRYGVNVRGTASRRHNILAADIRENQSDGGDAIGVYFNATTPDTLSIAADFADNDINFASQTNQRGNQIRNIADNWFIDNNVMVFKRQNESVVLTDNTSVDIFTVTLPDAGPLGFSAEVEYVIYDETEDAFHHEIDNFTVLYDTSSVNDSGVNAVFANQALIGATMSVTPALVSATGTNEATAVFSITQDHSLDRNCDIDVTVKIKSRGVGPRLNLDPSIFSWDI